MQPIQPFRAYDKENHRIRTVDTISFKHKSVSFVMRELGIRNLINECRLDDVEILYPAHQNDQQGDPLYTNQLVDVTSDHGHFKAKIVFENGAFGLVPLYDDLSQHYPNNPNDQLLFLNDLIWLNNDVDQTISTIKIIGYTYPDLEQEDIDHHHLLHE